MYLSKLVTIVSIALAVSAERKYRCNYQCNDKYTGKVIKGNDEKYKLIFSDNKSQEFKVLFRKIAAHGIAATVVTLSHQPARTAASRTMHPEATLLTEIRIQ